MRPGALSSSLDRPILRLAVPGLLASVSVPLIGIADTAMVGHLPEVALLGAVAAASVLFDFLFWSAGFLRMGTTSIVSQHHGAGRPGRLRRRPLPVPAARRRPSVCWRCCCGVPSPSSALPSSGEARRCRPGARRYFDVRVLGVPMVLATMVLNGFFLGSANAWAPLVVTVVTNAVNIGADYALIFGHWGAPALGVLGAAWASVLASCHGDSPWAGPFCSSSMERRSSDSDPGPCSTRRD